MRPTTPVLGTALCLALAGPALPAAASAPTMTVESGSFAHTFVGACAFPVSVAVDEPRARTVRFYDRDGNLEWVLLTGAAVATLTNDATGTTRRYNISGPTKVDPAARTANGHGPTLLIGVPGVPPVSIVLGDFVVTASDGLVSQNGAVVDVCAALG